MFTGIVENLAEIISIDKKKEYWKILISNQQILESTKVGDSISVNGVCLTASLISKKGIYFDVINETLNKTNLFYLKINDKVNIERPLKLNDRIDGHFVQGHVESVAKILNKINNDDETKIIVEIDTEFNKHCIYKGSICLDGISLTISNVEENKIEVSIIPHTLNNTTLLFKEEGDYLNVETDMLSKYVEKNLQYLKGNK